MGKYKVFMMSTAPFHSIFLGSGVVYAQDGAEGTVVERPPTTQETEESPRGLEEIVVTATRREERLQDIPVTVTAITNKTLNAAGIVDARSLTQVIPGFTGNRTASVIQPVIRGIGSGGVSVGDEPNVATYIDGVYQPDAFSNSLELVEVERVEVLRGPQGTVFGRNATGGLINVITPDPSFVTEGRFTARVGRLRNDANEYDLRAYVTTGLTDNIAVDFAGMYRQTEQYIPELSTGRKFGGIKVFDLRSKILLEASDTARFILTANYTRQRSNVNATQPLDDNTAARGFEGVILPDGPWETSLSLTPRIDYERFSASLRSRFEFEHFDIETTTAFMHNTGRQDADADSTNIDLGQILFPLEVQAESQEIRALSTGDGPFQWIVGFYAFHLDASMGPIELINSPPPGLGSPAPGTPIVRFTLSPETETLSFAGFTEGTLRVTDRLFLTLGGRYTTEKKEFQQAVNGNPLPYGRVDERFNKATYRTALRYELTDSANIYGSFGTGFKSGVYNVVSTSSTPVNPEVIEAAEIGFKADPLPWLRTNLSLFHYWYSDLQVQARSDDGNSYVLQNAADAKIYGGELEATILPTDEFTIRAAVTYNHGEYEEFPAAQDFIPLSVGGNLVTSNDAAGKSLIRAPEFTANLGLDWATMVQNGEFGATVNFFFSDRVYYDFLNRFSQDPYALVNGEISWTMPNDRVRFTLWGTNLSNAKVAQQIRQGVFATDILYEKPRTIGIGAEVSF